MSRSFIVVTIGFLSAVSLPAAFADDHAGMQQEHAEFTDNHEAMAKKHDQIKSGHEQLHAVLTQFMELMKSGK